MANLNKEQIDKMVEKAMPGWTIVPAERTASHQAAQDALNTVAARQTSDDVSGGMTDSQFLSAAAKNPALANETLSHYADTVAPSLDDLKRKLMASAPAPSFAADAVLSEAPAERVQADTARTVRRVADGTTDSGPQPGGGDKTVVLSSDGRVVGYQG